MRWNDNSDKLSVIKRYKELGFECSFINGNENDMNSYKNPTTFSNEITEQELAKVTGIGIILGKNNEYRAIDIDGFKIETSYVSDTCYDTLPRSAEYFFIKRCLALLGLPEDYEWLIRTPHGWHIIVSAPSYGFCNVAYQGKTESRPNVVPGNVIRFRNIELLWEGFLVMPPSEYGKYNWYRYYNQEPRRRPERIDAAHLLEFICFYCGEYNYITDLETPSLVPIIGGAHLFPYYDIEWDHGSQYYYEEAEKIKVLTKNSRFLSSCKNSLGFNLYGHLLVYDDLVNNNRVEKALNTAIKCFRMANDAMGHYNIACLIAIGAMNATIEELYEHLVLSVGFPDEYKDQLKQLYLACNQTYEKYAIIDIDTDENQRIKKAAILIVDAKGNVLNRRFLSNNGVLMQNIYYALQSCDYIVGCCLSSLEEIVKKECEITGYVFSEDDWTYYSSEEKPRLIHSEGYYLDAFRRAWIDLPPLNSYETDPCRRVYIIKDILAQELIKHKN